MEANPTLDQIRIFLAVADAGGFSAAARRMRRSQSVVSYAIANLEDQLQVQLFDREGTRQPRLTDAAKALLADARRVVSGLEGMRARAGGIRQGLETEVAAAVDSIVPSDVLVGVLGAFGQAFPTVGLRLLVGSMGVIHDQVSRGVADIGFGGEPARQDDGVETSAIGSITMLPVAAPGHPLALLPGPVPLALVRDHVQLVVSDLSDQTRGKDFGVFAFHTWRVTDLGMKRALTLAGLGWGGLPLAMVREDMAAGRLVRLDLEPYPQREFPIFAIRRVDRPTGPATAWMMRRFRESFLREGDQRPEK